MYLLYDAIRIFKIDTTPTFLNYNNSILSGFDNKYTQICITFTFNQANTPRNILNATYMCLWQMLKQKPPCIFVSIILWIHNAHSHNNKQSCRHNKLNIATRRMYQLPETWGVFKSPFVGHLKRWRHSAWCHAWHKSSPFSFKAEAGFQAFKSSTFRNLSGNLFSSSGPQWLCVPQCVCLCPAFVREGSLRVWTAAGWGQGGAGKWHRPQRSVFARSPSVTLPIKTPHSVVTSFEPSAPNLCSCFIEWSHEMTAT